MNLPKKKTILVVSHGSRENSANPEFVRLVGKYRRRHPGWKVSHAFLDIASPSIPDALEKMARGKGVREMLVLPYFLFAAKHVKKDIPAILENFREKYPGTRIKFAGPLGSDPKLLEILDRRLSEA